jgi:hypothetical protein
MDFGFIFSIFIAFSAPIGMHIFRTTSNKLHKFMSLFIMIGLFLLLLLGVALPLVTGSWATSFSEGWEPGARIKIPKYEYEVYNFLSKSLLHGQRILSLPLQGPLTGTTNYFATDILLFMGIPSFSGYGYMPELDNKIYIALANQINSEDTRNFSQELRS